MISRVVKEVVVVNFQIFGRETVRSRDLFGERRGKIWEQVISYLSGPW